MGSYIGSRRGAYYKPWTPDKLGPALYLWLDGTDRSTLTSVSSKITAWRDKSVYQNHLAQSNTSYQPLDLNPPTVQNTSGLLTSVSSNAVLPYGTQDRTIILCCLNYSGRNNTTQCALTYGGSNGVGILQYDFGNGTSTGDSGSQEFQIYTDTSHGPLGAIGTIYNSVLIKTISLSNQQVSTSRNGSKLYTGSCPYNTTSGQLMLFNNLNNNIGYQGLIFDVIIASTADPLTVARIEGYIAWKRGLQGSLPSSHAFKSKPPLILA